jgi:hypothetical protein
VRSAEGGEHFGCPFTNTTNKNVDQLTEHVIKNIRPAISKVTNMLGISFDSVQSTVTDNLSMYWITAKTVPRTCEH